MKTAERWYLPPSWQPHGTWLLSDMASPVCRDCRGPNLPTPRISTLSLVRPGSGLVAATSLVPAFLRMVNSSAKDPYLRGLSLHHIKSLEPPTRPRNLRSSRPGHQVCRCCLLVAVNGEGSDYVQFHPGARRRKRRRKIQRNRWNSRHKRKALKLALRSRRHHHPLRPRRTRDRQR